MINLYKARVEQIDGINVRAGGKWLRCIGNRTVHVGDLIFTDGKYVYGYDKESQTPVIAETPKVDELVPLLVGEVNEKSFSCFWNAYDLTTNTLKKFSQYPFIINNSSHLGAMTNNSQEIYFRHRGRIATNIDEQGNLYQLSWHTLYGEKGVTLTISKNNDFSEIKIDIDGWITDDWVTGFIENEDNWWIVYCSYGQERMSTTQSPDEYTLNYLYIHREICLVTNKGSHRLLAYDINVQNISLWATPLDEIEGTFIESYKDVKFPMQDGFYFKINSVETNPRIVTFNNKRVGFTGTIDITIFSPDGATVLPIHLNEYSSQVFIPLYFSAIRLSRKKFLVCAYNPRDSRDTVYNALYLCHEGSYKKILDNVAFFNQCLRPMNRTLLKKWIRQNQSAGD